MALTFPEYNYTDAQQAVNDDLPAWIGLNRRYYEDDHWQDGAGWTGPRPEVGNASYTTVMAEIARSFVSQNTIARVVDRHASAVAGREIAWGLTVRRPLKDGEMPTEAEMALIREAEAALTEWWDAQGVQVSILETVRTSQWAGSAPLRLFVPEGKRDANGMVGTKPDLAEALALIFLDMPAPESFNMVTDTKTMGKAGIYLYTDDDETDWAEICYLDQDGKTVVKILGREQAEEYALDLGGRLLHHQLKAKLLITDSVRRNQRLLNKALTMLDRNVDLAGFLERTLLNAQLPGAYEKDANGVSRFVPAPLHVGPGSINAFVGVLTEDDTGASRLATPDIVYRDPVPVTTFEGTKSMALKSILEDTHQLHAIMAGDATATGEARRQAMAEFESSIRPTKSVTDQAVRWLLETALALASLFSGQAGKYADLRVNADCKLFSGPPPSDEIPNTINLHARHLLSRRTAMSRVGVEDPDAELAMIEAEMETAMAQQDEERRRIEEGLRNAGGGANQGAEGIVSTGTADGGGV